MILVKFECSTYSSTFISLLYDIGFKQIKIPSPIQSWIPPSIIQTILSVIEYLDLKKKKKKLWLTIRGWNSQEKPTLASKQENELIDIEKCYYVFNFIKASNRQIHLFLCYVSDSKNRQKHQSTSSGTLDCDSVDEIYASWRDMQSSLSVTIEILRKLLIKQIKIHYGSIA